MTAPRVSAVVLAGGTTKPAARAQGWPEYRALAEVGGRPALAWVLDALRRADSVDEIAVVGPEAARPLLEGATLLPTGETMWDNVATGLKHAAGTALLCGADVPMLTPEAVDDVVTRGLARDAGFVYPIVRREDNEAQFPGLSRTYATVREGTFTGGNLMLVNGPELLAADALIRAALAARKRPLALVRLLRPSPILIGKVLLKRATVGDLERAVGRILGVRAAALPTAFAEVGADLDRPDETPIVENLMRRHGRLP